MSPTIAVVVCTAGRPDLLVGCLDRLAELDGWSPGDEVVVVANGPDRDAAAGATTGHRALAAAAAEAGVQVRVLTQEAAELAAARDLGARSATAELLVYLDDDARPAAAWLAALRRATGAHPALGVAGGPIRLVWPHARPPVWFHPDNAAVWAGLDLGSAERRLVPPEVPFGANLAVRRSVLVEVGGFAPTLGRADGGLRGGEDTELARRIMATGHEGWWLPDAAVDHLVGSARARLRYLLRRAWAQGRTTDPALGRIDGRWLPVVAGGWGRLVRDLRTEPAHWRRHVARDAARRTRLAGRAQASAAARRATRGSGGTPR